MGGAIARTSAAKAFGTFLTTPEKALDYDGKQDRLLQLVSRQRAHLTQL